MSDILLERRNFLVVVAQEVDIALWWHIVDSGGWDSVGDIVISALAIHARCHKLLGWCIGRVDAVVPVLESCES